MNARRLILPTVLLATFAAVALLVRADALQSTSPELEIVLAGLDSRQSTIQRGHGTFRMEHWETTDPQILKRQDVPAVLGKTSRGGPLLAPPRDITWAFDGQRFAESVTDLERNATTCRWSDGEVFRKYGIRGAGPSYGDEYDRRYVEETQERMVTIRSGQYTSPGSPAWLDLEKNYLPGAGSIADNIRLLASQRRAEFAGVREIAGVSCYQVDAWKEYRPEGVPPTSRRISWYIAPGRDYAVIRCVDATTIQEGDRTGEAHQVVFEAEEFASTGSPAVWAPRKMAYTHSFSFTDGVIAEVMRDTLIALELHMNEPVALSSLEKKFPAGTTFWSSRDQQVHTAD